MGRDNISVYASFLGARNRIQRSLVRGFGRLANIEKKTIAIYFFEFTRSTRKLFK